MPELGMFNGSIATVCQKRDTEMPQSHLGLRAPVSSALSSGKSFAGRVRTRISMRQTFRL